MKRLLVCIDGSHYAASCCQYAAWIARKENAAIQVVYITDLRQFEVPFVADLSGSLGIQPFQAVMSQLQKLEDKKARVIFEQARNSLAQAGFKDEIETVHKTGFLADSLNELEEGMDMVLLGKRGENANFATEHLGSTMERVVRASSKPCFVASRSFREVKRVLLAYQRVASCRHALEFIRSSAMLKGLEIHVINVSQNEEETVALDTLREAESRLQESGIEPVCHMLHGTPSHAISTYAKENAIDLLVMGAYGHSRLRHLFIGSSTAEMLRDCRLPTMLFR